MTSLAISLQWQGRPVDDVPFESKLIHLGPVSIVHPLKRALGTINYRSEKPTFREVNLPWTKEYVLRASRDNINALINDVNDLTQKLNSPADHLKQFK